jgi:Trk K+ transport system NAD-binding subunit
VPPSTAASRLVADLRYLTALLRQFRLTFLLAAGLFGVVPLLYVWGWRGPSGQRVGWGAAAHHVYFLLFGNPSLPYTDSVPMEVLNVLVPLLGVAVLADGVVRFGHLFFAKRGHAKEWIAVRTQGMDQHVIVVGAGRVGYRVTEHLRALGRDVVVLENRADAPLAAALREEGVPVLLEDARTPGALGRCNVARASAVVCSTDDDLVNLNVALDARRENPAIRVVIRVFDEDLARKVREGFGSEALSASGLAAPALAIAALDPRVRNSFQSGEHLFVVSDFVAAAPLATLTVAGLRDRFGALTLSLERGGAVRPHPPGDTRVAERDRLLVQALWPDYRRLREHLGEGAPPRGP